MCSFKNNFSFGIQMANEFYGPRAEWDFKIFKEKE